MIFMKNQVKNNTELNAPALVIIMGIVFGAILFLVANATFGNFVLGAIIGLILALIFNYVMLPYKPHDR